MFAPNLYKGKVVLVTGGGTGLGFSIATEYAKLGADLVIASRNLERLQQVARELQNYGNRVLALPLNVKSYEECGAICEKIYNEWGQLDILINNAGGQFPAHAEDLTPKGWQAVLDLNLSGSFYMSQHAAKIMRQQGGGHIINIVAPVWDRPVPGAVHMGAARAGQIHATKTLAVEWAKDQIHVNAVAPGVFLTEGAQQEMMLNADNPHMAEQLVENVPLKRLGRAEEVGYACLFLTSPFAEYITGHCLVVDGGITLGKGIFFRDY